MSKLSENFNKFISSGQRSEEGKQLLKNLNYSYQFELTDEDPFYMELNGGKILVKEGVSPLDWKKKDWEKINRIWTDREMLTAVLKGETEIAEAQFMGRWSYSSWVATHSEQKWLTNLIRIAREQISREAIENCFRD